MIGSTLDTVGQVARTALAWAAAPQSVYVAVAAGGALLVGVVAAVVIIALRRRTTDGVDGAVSSEASREHRVGTGSTRILLLRVEGDPDGVVGRRITDILSRGLDNASVVDGSNTAAKAGRDFDDEVRRARAQAAKARAGAVLWGAVAGDVVRLRIIGEGGEGPCEAYSFPADLATPFEAALVAVVAVCGDHGASLVRAAEQIAPAAPNDAGNAARVRAVKARTGLALHTRDRDRSRLDAALAATAVADPRKDSEPLEWAEVQALRGEALRRAVLGLAEPPRRELSEGIDVWRAAMDVWSEEGAADRAERAQPALAQALLDLADAENDARGLEEAAQLTEAALARRDPRANGADATALTALLGSVHLRLGEREPRPTRLETAERELRRALVLAEAGNDRARAAAVQDELARALAKLGERDRGTERLRAAAVIYRLSLADNQRNELSRARARAALGRALVSVGERDRDAGAVDEAVAALRTAANSFVSCGAPAAAAQARRALERAERLYGELRAAARATVDS